MFMTIDNSTVPRDACEPVVNTGEDCLKRGHKTADGMTFRDQTDGMVSKISHRCTLLDHVEIGLPSMHCYQG